MAVTNTLKLKVAWNGDLSEGATTDIDDRTGHSRLAGTLTFNQGAGADSINLQVVGSETIAPSGSITIDLAGGGLVSPFNETGTFTKVRPLWVLVTEGTGPIVAGGANNTFNFGMGSASNTLTFNPWLICGRDDSTGLGVTAGTGDKLVLSNSGADTATVQYGIAGES